MMFGEKMHEVVSWVGWCIMNVALVSCLIVYCSTTWNCIVSMVCILV